MRNIYCRKYPQCHLFLFRSHPHFIKYPYIPNHLIMAGLYCLSIMFNLSIIILLNLIIYNCFLCCCNVFIIITIIRFNVLHNFSSLFCLWFFEKEGYKNLTKFNIKSNPELLVDITNLGNEINNMTQTLEMGIHAPEVQYKFWKNFCKMITVTHIVHAESQKL